MLVRLQNDFRFEGNPNTYIKLSHKTHVLTTLIWFVIKKIHVYILLSSAGYDYEEIIKLQSQCSGILRASYT